MCFSERYSLEVWVGQLTFLNLFETNSLWNCYKLLHVASCQKVLRFPIVYSEASGGKLCLWVVNWIYSHLFPPPQDATNIDQFQRFQLGISREFPTFQCHPPWGSRAQAFGPLRFQQPSPDVFEGSARMECGFVYMGFPHQQQSGGGNWWKWPWGLQWGRRCWTWVCVGGVCLIGIPSLFVAMISGLQTWIGTHFWGWWMPKTLSQGFVQGCSHSRAGGYVLYVMFHPTAPILPFNDRDSMRSHFASKVLPMHQQWSLVFLGYRKVHHFPHIFQTWMNCGTTATKKATQIMMWRQRTLFQNI